MAIFNSYVKLPEGNPYDVPNLHIKSNESKVGFSQCLIKTTWIDGLMATLLWNLSENLEMMDQKSPSFQGEQHGNPGNPLLF